MNSLATPVTMGNVALALAKSAGQPFDLVHVSEAIEDGSVGIQLISRRSAKGWAKVLPRDLRTQPPKATAAYLMQHWPETFGQPVDPKEEKRAQIQLLARKIAESGAQIAQQMADLTKLITELE